MAKKFSIKEYAKQFHVGPVGKRTQQDNDSGRLTWRDIPKRMVTLDRWNFRDQPTVVEAKPKTKLPLEPTVWVLKKGYVYYAGDGNGRIKIGQSSNPWSRVSEMKCANPSIEVLATEKSEDVYALERQRHKQFKEDHLALEWFKASEKLLAHVSELKNSQS